MYGKFSFHFTRNWVTQNTGLNINISPIPVKTDVEQIQVDLVLRLSDRTSEKMTVLPFEGYFL